jgi:peptidoglycan-associated lipoprotein
MAIAASLLVACASHPKPLPLAPTATPPPTAQQAPYAGPEPSRDAVRSSVLPGSVQDFVINAGDRIYFDYDEFNLRPDALPVLTAQAAWLGRYPEVQVRIEGNADERGTREYNFALGARRANAVKDFLEERGVNAGRITTVSYGKERPIDPGPGEEAWAHNRNAHTAIIAGAR